MADREDSIRAIAETAVAVAIGSIIAERTNAFIDTGAIARQATRYAAQTVDIVYEESARLAKEHT